MSVRRCLPSDLPFDGAPWLVADEELGERGRSLVEESDERVVAVGRRPRSRGAFDMSELECLSGHGAEVLRALVAADPSRPLALRVVPHTPKAAAVDAVGGGEVLQSLPPAHIPTGHPEVEAWIGERIEDARREGVELRPGSAFTTDELVDLAVDPYVRQHAHWAPVGDVDALPSQLRRWFAADLDADATSVALVQGRPVAVTYLASEIDGVPVPLLMEIQPGHPRIETCAAATMAATLEAVSPRPVEFEGHADEAVYMRVLGTIPRRSAGTLTPMDIVQIRADVS